MKRGSKHAWIGIYENKINTGMENRHNIDKHESGYVKISTYENKTKQCWKTGTTGMNGNQGTYENEIKTVIEIWVRARFDQDMSDQKTMTVIEIGIKTYIDHSHRNEAIQRSRHE